MTDGYIKLWRKLLDGEMIKNHKLLTFWIWCLLKASHKSYKVTVGFQEIELLPGQFIFGLNIASRETKLSIQNIRYCLRSLQGSQNLTIKTTNKFSVLTIVNWELYQSNDIVFNNQNNKQVTNKRQTSNNKQEYKEEEKETNNSNELLSKKFEAIENSFSEQQLKLKSDFLDYWTEKSDGGIKERWQFEKVFDIKKRFRTWIKNEEKKNMKACRGRIVTTPVVVTPPPEPPEVEPDFMNQYPLLTVACREQMIKIYEEINRKSFDTWFAPMRFIKKDGETFIISADTESSREWIAEHYSKLLKTAFGEYKLVTYKDLTNA